MQLVLNKKRKPLHSNDLRFMILYGGGAGSPLGFLGPFFHIPRRQTAFITHLKRSF